jgi:hypothetical protein
LPYNPRRHRKRVDQGVVAAGGHGWRKARRGHSVEVQLGIFQDICHPGQRQVGKVLVDLGHKNRLQPVAISVAEHTERTRVGDDDEALETAIVGLLDKTFAQILGELALGYAMPVGFLHRASRPSAVRDRPADLAGHPALCPASVSKNLTTDSRG